LLCGAGAVDARLHGPGRLLAAEEREERSRLLRGTAEGRPVRSQSAVRLQQRRFTVGHEHRKRPLDSRLIIIDFLCVSVADPRVRSGPKCRSAFDRRRAVTSHNLVACGE